MNPLDRPASDVVSDHDVLSNIPLHKLLCGVDLQSYLGSTSDLSEDRGRSVVVNCEGRTSTLDIGRFTQGVLVVAEDISRHLSDKAEAFAAARTDPDSGLGNPLMFRERLTEFMQGLDPAKDVAAVLTISFDRFKAVGASLDQDARNSLLRLCQAPSWAGLIHSWCTGGAHRCR